MGEIRNRYKKGPFWFFLLVYLFAVLWFTVLKRSSGYHAAQFEVFWSYRKWFAGDMELGKEIMANIAMFIPFGFLSATLNNGQRKNPAVIVLALLFSLTIEILQLVLMRGLFEWDDVISNILGAALGILLLETVEKICNNKRRAFAVEAIGAAFVLICLVVYIIGRGVIGVEADTTPRAYCFQIDEATLVGNELNLTGFAFPYERSSASLSLTLRSKKTGKKTELTTSYGIAREDIKSYFHCEYDYLDTGFTATATVNPDEEYEIMLGRHWPIMMSTGVFVTGERVHYFSDEAVSTPALDEDFVTKGTLRVYREDFHCWVYQYEWALYWIVDRDFYFEEDGTTYIQYQLWTTQTEKLPEKRLVHNNLWDNIGGYFEEYEIEGEFGDYRVMKRDLPTAYSITSIVTGYYNNGHWIWKNYFRPIYPV